MKKFLAFVILFYACSAPAPEPQAKAFALQSPTLPISVFPKGKVVKIGNGSGSISVKDMTGLVPGDSLQIVPGAYNGGWLGALKGIVITGFDQATFTGQVTLSKLSECIFEHVNFLNVPDIAIRWDGNSRRTIERWITFTNCKGSCNDAQDQNFYTGDTSSLKLYIVAFDHLTLSKSGQVIQAAYGGTKDGKVYVDSVIFSNIKIDSTITNGTEFKGIFFRTDMYNIAMVSGNITLQGDVGMFLIDANGSFRNIYHKGGRGYIGRVRAVSFKAQGVKEVRFYNNVDLNTNSYGTIDIRTDSAGTYNQYVTGANSYVYNNTSMHKTNGPDYWASVAVVGAYPKPYFCKVWNNLGIALTTNGKPPIAADQSGGTWNNDTSHNMYFAYAKNVADSVTGIPTLNSPVIAKGLPISWIKDDIYGNARVLINDIGAVQTGGSIPNPCRPDTIKIIVHDTIQIHDTVPAKVISTKIIFKDGSSQTLP